jgi:hypothetical protein
MSAWQENCLLTTAKLIIAKNRLPENGLLAAAARAGHFFPD